MHYTQEVSLLGSSRVCFLNIKCPSCSRKYGLVPKPLETGVTHHTAFFYILWPHLATSVPLSYTPGFLSSVQHSLDLYKNLLFGDTLKMYRTKTSPISENRKEWLILIYTQYVSFLANQINLFHIINKVWPQDIL